MKKRMKEKGRQLLAVILCFLTVIGLIPTEVLAFTPQEGETVSSFHGDYYMGSDGTYYVTGPHHYIIYGEDGDVTIYETDEIYAYRKYMIRDNGGEERQVYCIESGVPFEPSDNEYISTSGKNSKYFQMLPDTAQYGIMMASIYGWQPGKSAPIEGCNVDDYAVATQMIMWEYQQQIRTNPHDLKTNKYGVEANAFYQVIQGRPAEKCYDWILEQIDQHMRIPSFSSDQETAAPTHTLKYDASTKQYSLTLEDTNNTMADLKIDQESGITVSRSGNRYTFTSNKVLTDPVIIEAQKDVPGVENDMLIWGRVNYQTMMCGSSDPVLFYLKLNTETFGTAMIKKNSEDGKIGGIQFHVTGNGVDEIATTESDGTVSISLMPGTYTVTEITEEWYEEQNTQSVTIVSGQTAIVTFNNQLKCGSLEVIKSSEDEMVEGITFHLYGTALSGEAVDAYAVTDSNGKATFTDIPVSGTEPYTLEETDTPDRYVIPAAQTAVIEWNKVTQRRFENVLKKFRLQVKKADGETGDAQGEASLAGAVYGLYQGEELVASYTTDADGSFTTDYFICGNDWTLREISPSEGYLLDATVYPIPAEPGDFSIELNPIAEDVFEQVIKGRIRIVKHIDAEQETEDPANYEIEATVEESSSTTLADMTAIQEEYSNTTTVAAIETEEVTTEAAMESSEINPSVLEESQMETAPTVETEDTSVETSSDPAEEETVQIPETEYKPEEISEDEWEASGGQGIIEQPEEGAKFEVYLTSAGSYDNARETERDLIVTDADGFAVTKDLPYGQYTVHQTEGKAGQAFVKDFNVFIRDNDETYSYIINNQTQSSLIKIEKHDAETGKIIPSANIGFQVRDCSTGELVTQTIYYPTPLEITTFFTNAEGWLMLPEELPFGNYELIEVETAYGYVLDSEPVPFVVDGGQDVVVVEKANIAQKGTITIAKKGEVWSGVSVNDENGEEAMYSPVYTVQGLPGAVYEIRAAEDITTLDGTVRVSKGDVVDTVTTDEDGNATSKELYLGKYEITEVQAPYSLVKNPTPQVVELTYAGQDVALTETSTSFYNERQKIQISLEKRMEQDELFGIGGNLEGTKVSFGLYAAEDLIAADGSIIPADGLIEILAVSADGIAVSQADLPLGSYYLQERATEGHYLVSDKKYPVVFEYAGQDTVLVEVKANGGEAILNELIYGNVSGRKVNENGEALAGAKIGLFAATAEEFTEENAILVSISDENGTFRFEQVPFGKWVVREIEAPEGFVLCEDLYEVNIGVNEQVVELEMTNESIRGNLHLTKIDKDYPDYKLSGAVFEVYRDSNNNKELDEEDELLGNMEEVERGEYVMKDLLYGGVFVKEKVAPEGFYLDDGIYYIDIKNDGETYEVENEEGKGFYNRAQQGNLKIVKTSSDGKTEGFSFRITGDNYDQTFKTDANGEILIENLRIGKYTVTEVEDSASANYRRPDPITVELITDQTLVVNVHNNKITVESPETGDTTNSWFWIGLMAFGGISAGMVVLIGKRKKASSKKQ